MSNKYGWHLMSDWPQALQHLSQTTTQLDDLQCLFHALPQIRYTQRSNMWKSECNTQFSNGEKKEKGTARSYGDKFIVLTMNNKSLSKRTKAFRNKPASQTREWVKWEFLVSTYNTRKNESSPKLSRHKTWARRQKHSFVVPGGALLMAGTVAVPKFIPAARTQDSMQTICTCRAQHTACTAGARSRTQHQSFKNRCLDIYIYTLFTKQGK